MTPQDRLQSVDVNGDPSEASMKPQLSLRDLCLVVLVVALGCGWWTEHRRARAAEARAESLRAEAVQNRGHLKLFNGLQAAVERSGFHIQWDLHGVPQRLIPARELAGPPAGQPERTAEENRLAR